MQEARHSEQLYLLCQLRMFHLGPNNLQGDRFAGRAVAVSLLCLPADSEASPAKLFLRLILQPSGIVHNWRCGVGVDQHVEVLASLYL